MKLFRAYGLNLTIQGAEELKLKMAAMVAKVIEKTLTINLDGAGHTLFTNDEARARFSLLKKGFRAVLSSISMTQRQLHWSKFCIQNVWTLMLEADPHDDQCPRQRPLEHMLLSGCNLNHLIW